MNLLRVKYVLLEVLPFRSAFLSFMSTFASTAIQKDWNHRDFIEAIQLNLLQITEFLNGFERATKTKLASVNEKMSKVTRLCVRFPTNACSFSKL